MTLPDLVLEGLVTTLNADRTINISPMGPRVDRDVTRLVLRPFASSQTYENLKRHRQGVFHVTDDVELLARCAIHRLDELPALTAAPSVDGQILADACRWYAFRTTAIDDREPRVTIECEVVDQGRIRDFFGFNRAKHAVIEAAILSTRLDLLPRQEVLDQMRTLETWVEKTGGDQERRAFALLRAFVDAYPERGTGSP